MAVRSGGIIVLASNPSDNPADIKKKKKKDSVLFLSLSDQFIFHIWMHLFPQIEK